MPEELTDGVKKTLKEEYDSQYANLNLDLSNQAVQSLSQFKDYAQAGTAFEWDRYNTARSLVLIDKLEGKITTAAQVKSRLDEWEKSLIIERSLGNYINLVYRFIKSCERQDRLAAILDGQESIGYLLESLFAMHSRVRPYNKYLQWELQNFPIADLPSSNEAFLHNLYQTSNGDVKSAQRLYAYLKGLAHQEGWQHYYEAWGKNSKKLQLITDFQG